MSEHVIDTTEGHGVHPEGDGHPHHPSDAQYVKIAIFLAAVTGLEVGLYYTKLSQPVTNGMLLALAGLKFVMVVAYFMHLKFDNKILRRLFTTGFVLATFCYVLYLLTMGVFR